VSVEVLLDFASIVPKRPAQAMTWQGIGCILPGPVANPTRGDIEPLTHSLHREQL
jgi:hypothetical protein